MQTGIEKNRARCWWKRSDKGVTSRMAMRSHCAEHVSGRWIDLREGI